MKWVLIGAAILSAIAVLIVAIGARLPQGHVTSKQAIVGPSPEAVWAALTDLDAYPSWRTGVKRIERLPDRAGRTTWIEHGKNGAITFTIDSDDPPRRLVVRIADPDLAFGGTWTYEIARVPEGTRLIITENGEVYNPVFRFMSQFVFGHEATLIAYLEDLRTRLEQRAGSTG